MNVGEAGVSTFRMRNGAGSVGGDGQLVKHGTPVGPAIRAFSGKLELQVFHWF